ncbi:MAG: hypothetical protein ACI83O_000664 [Patescibacteria group bacterium]|jgi:hypothetical protein
MSNRSQNITKVIGPCIFLFGIFGFAFALHALSEPQDPKIFIESDEGITHTTSSKTVAQYFLDAKNIDQLIYARVILVEKEASLSKASPQEKLLIQAQITQGRRAIKDKLKQIEMQRELLINFAEEESEEEQ